MKVYCKNCKWYEYQPMNSMLFNHRCWHPQYIKTENTPIEFRKKSVSIQYYNFNSASNIGKEDRIILNKNNDCHLYYSKRRTWWKFWV